MPLTASDKALRSLVAELATTTSEDMAAVLGMLDPKSAAQVRALLAAYGGVDDVFELEADTSYVNTSGLSDWLAARVQGRPLDGVAAYRMTPDAVEALREIATAMPHTPGMTKGAAARPLPDIRDDALNHRFRSLFGKRDHA